MTMQITLSTPEEARIATSDPAAPGYVPPDQVRLSFTNRGEEPLSFPGPAIVQQVVREYSLRRGMKKQTFARSEPPSDRPQLIELAPGESWSWGFRFEFPDELAPMVERAEPLTICAVWDRAGLDTGLYPPGSYGWAESFRACGETRFIRR